MKKGWKIFIKVVDAIVWLWDKIKQVLPSTDNKKDNDVEPLK